MESLDFLESSGRGKLQPVYVLHGDEDFLKRQVLGALRKRVFGAEGDDFGLSTHAGETATFAAVCDELETLPFLGPRRLVVVENADPFVTHHRAVLEKYVTGLEKREPAGVLVLVVKTWPANTRLAKLVTGSITCKAPAGAGLPAWCGRWSSAQYGKELAAPAARMLVDLVGTEMGQLDQELAKLATYVGKAARIEVADVDQLVASSRLANVFKIFDALADGRPPEAFRLLDSLFDLGEDPIRILGAFSYQLRRLAQVARLCQQGLSFAAAAERVGLPPFARQGCERQLRQLGRRRTDRLFDWLVEVDLGLKGSSQLPPRTQIERLLVRLS